MEKMPAPELEIIPFNTEDDVIVTSGIAGIPVENNRWYATAGSELIEAGIPSYGSSNSKEVDKKRTIKESVVTDKIIVNWRLYL